MKPFDLEKAKAGKPVVTRDGRPVRIICFNMVDNNGGYPLVALVCNKNGVEEIRSYNQEGHFIKGDEHDLDLLMFSELTEEINATYYTTATLKSFQHCNFIFKK